MSNRPTNLRTALIAEATALIEAVGHDAFNTRALAARVGVTQPALYRHFESREALFQAVMVEGFAEFDTFAEQVVGDDDPYGRLHRLGVGGVRFGVARPGWFRLCFGRRGALAALFAEVRDIPRGQALALSALARVVPPDDPDFGDAYRAWWGLVHGLTFLSIERVFSLVDNDEARVAAAEAAIASHLTALRARWGPPKPDTGLDPMSLFSLLIPRGTRGPQSPA